MVTFLLLFLASMAFVSSAECSLKPGDCARYAFYNIKKDAKPAVQQVTVRVGLKEKRASWWEVEGKKEDGSIFAVRVLSERVPMTGPDGLMGRVQRYLFKDGDRPYLEYRDKNTGEPLLPFFDFESQLVPNPSPESPVVGGFATSGTYIGNGVQLIEVSSETSFGEPENVVVLDLDPRLMVGTGRPFRDIDEGRVSDRDYSYRNFLPEEYDEMMEAGMNSFMIWLKLQKKQG